MKKKLFVVGLLTLIFSMALAMTSCDKVSKFALVEPTNIAYSGTAITWDKVDAANYYLIQIDDKTEQKREQNSFAFDANKSDFVVKVTAVKGKKEKSTTQEFRHIASVSAVNADANGVISWDAIEGATAYRLKINGKELDSDITENSYNLLPEGNNNVQVLPVVAGDKSIFSEWSEGKAINIIPMPSNIKYDGETLSWTATLGVTKYLVYINGTQMETKESKIDYNANSADFSFQIKAVGNGTNTFDSKLSELQTFYYLATASNIRVEDGILAWDEVANCQGYLIKINGVVKSETLKTNRYESLLSNCTEEISIKPLGKQGYSFSNWSAPKVLYLLQTPEIKWNSSLESSTTEVANNILWNVVNNAEGYDVKVTFGNLVNVVGLAKSSTSYGNSFAKVGEYELRVKAKAGIGATGTTTYDSKYSTPIKITRLPMPSRAKEQFIISDANNIQHGFSLSYSVVDNVSGYQLYKDKAPVDGAFSTTNQMQVNNVIAKEVTAEQKISYAIKSIGKIKNKDIVFLDSIEMLDAPVTVLAMPANTKMQGFNLTWSGVDKANSYAVSAGAKTIVEKMLECNLGILEAGIFDINVCARGNGQDVLSSNYSAAIKVERLNSPTNIKFDTLGSGKLLWDPVLNASSYTVYLDTNPIGFNSEMTAEFADINKHIATTGTALTMQAIANKYDSNGTIYYMTSQHTNTMQITKLMTPTFPNKAFSYSFFRWVAPANVNVGVYTPTYQVKNDKNINLNGEFKGTSIDITMLEAGRHSLAVRAIGDGQKFVNSDWTDDNNIAPKSITKLAAPIVRKEADQYTWNTVGGASEYIVTIDGKKALNAPNIVNSVVSFKPLFERAKTYKVEVIAVGDDGLTTINSDPTKIDQVVLTLDIPQISLSYDKEVFDPSGSLTVTIAGAITNSNGYKYNIGGTIRESAELVYKFYPQAPSNIDVFVVANGGKIVNDIFYIDSLPSQSQTILLLQKPNEIKYYGDGVLTFNGVGNAIGYEYYIAYDGADYDMTQPVKITQVTALDSTEIAPTGHSNFKIKIRAKGNGSNIITSEWIEFRQERL